MGYRIRVVLVMNRKGRIGQEHTLPRARLCGRRAGETVTIFDTDEPNPA